MRSLKRIHSNQAAAEAAKVELHDNDVIRKATNKLVWCTARHKILIEERTFVSMSHLPLGEMQAKK